MRDRYKKLLLEGQGTNNLDEITKMSDELNPTLQHLYGVKQAEALRLKQEAEAEEARRK